MPGVKRIFETAEEELQQEEQSAKKAKLPGDHSKLTERLNKLNNKQLRWVFIEIVESDFDDFNSDSLNVLVRLLLDKYYMGRDNPLQELHEHLRCKDDPDDEYLSPESEEEAEKQGRKMHHRAY